MPARAAAIVLLSLGVASAHGAAAQELASGEPASTFTIATWARGLSAPTDVAFLSDGRAVITEKDGGIVVLQPDGSVQRPEGARLRVDTASEKGLLGVVRDDADTLYLYASDGDDTADKHHVYRATIDAAGVVSVDSSHSIIGGGLEGPANHDGGGMVIHRGQLYVGVGDTGYNASPPTNRYGTCLNKANAKILRVELDGSIPRDNPLVGMSAVTGCADQRGAFEMLPPDERIYAWGLRNPWRLYVDPVTDLLWIGDVGEITQEEITVGGKGAHHGWPFFEGTVDHGELGGMDDCADVVPSGACVAPQHGYPRGDGVSVTGGLIPPAGCGWGAFEQRYVFGDFGNGRVWTLDLTADRRGAVPGSRRDFAEVPSNVSFRVGPDAALYVVSFETGTIARIAPRSVPGSCGASAPVGSADGGGPIVSAPGGGDSGGCGCRVATARSNAGALAGVALAAVALARRVRRRRV